MVLPSSPRVAKRGGFTLIEMLIVLSIGVILGTIGILSLSNYRREQSLRLSAQSIVAFLKDAQSRSISQEEGLQWGVRFYEPAGGRDSYYLFTDPAVPRSVVALPASVEFDPASGPFPKDVTFARTGLPLSSAAVIIRLSGNPTATRTITVNAQGTIVEN